MMAEVDPQLQDHTVGLEMEIVELARQADQAASEGWPGEEARLRQELEKLYAELATSAERLADQTIPTPGPTLDAVPATDALPSADRGSEP